MGVGIQRQVVEDMANSIGCSVMQKSFRYLGVMVGEYMSQLKPWNVVVSKLKARLSKWKAKTLSCRRGSLHYSISSDGEFSVKDTRSIIDDMFLPSHDVPTRWVKGVPGKINIFTWKARRDVLPTRYNLIRRLFNLDSDRCPICKTSVEDVSHIFFYCSLAQSISKRICRWWELDWHQWSSFSEWLEWFSNIRLSSKVKSLLEGVFMVAWWTLWGFRNRMVFESTPPKRSMLFDDV
ncbi:RNA-directed DNA polymerase, eukaryota, partial [Tanacetum coccineum]